ncbi:hypothetical protein [Mucilaginibacter paludis]|uniref:Outer membrane protein beta-barrel domain-containing protein n=1 Tax=Mucilaginibacter paludis DSM 18603 TaxID=714943 RepID=H1YDL7_9SPHI|nr:hypothetical protein [Mucilaginibacter paludis]EHQ30706.1 hypothetical protein Mucpa_6655 [Mucilaginibacter paludis DSM 18603]
MNTSTKWIASAVTAVAILFGSNVKAQQTKANPGDVWRLGVGVEAGLPTGNLHDASNFELGGTARLQYDTRSNLSIMLTSGYYNAFFKDVAGVSRKDLGIVPVKAGLKVFANDNIYFSGEVGAGFETNYAKNTKLIVSPGIGYANYKGLDVGLRYENFSGQSNNYGLVGLRIAYGFKL